MQTCTHTQAQTEETTSIKDNHITEILITEKLFLALLNVTEKSRLKERNS